MLKDVYAYTELQKISKNSFLMLTVIGIGSYAKVFLVKKKNTGTIYALKMIKKSKIKRKKQHEHLKTERFIMVFPLQISIF